MQNIPYPKTRRAGILNVIAGAVCLIFTVALIVRIFSGAILPPADDANDGIGNAVRVILGVPYLLIFSGFCLLLVFTCVLVGVKLMKAGAGNRITNKTYAYSMIMKIISIPFFVFAVIVLTGLFRDFLFSTFTLLLVLLVIATFLYERKERKIVLAAQK